jgi:hypothetical protein
MQNVLYVAEKQLKVKCSTLCVESQVDVYGALETHTLNTVDT